MTPAPDAIRSADATQADEATRNSTDTRISAATTVVGVIGDPVLHSLSPLLHNTAFAEMGLDWVSVGFPVPAGQAEAALAGMRALGIVGLSVTMPHKEAVAGLVDRTTPVATRLAAVNCVTAASGRASWRAATPTGKGSWPPCAVATDSSPGTGAAWWSGPVARPGRWSWRWPRRVRPR